MFEHRLGSLLRKSIGEVRALPAPEFRRWQLFYLLEPWGFADQEYRTAALIAAQVNTHSTKGGKKASDYMRDMLSGALEGRKPPLDFENMSEEEKEAYRRMAISKLGAIRKTG